MHQKAFSQLLAKQMTRQEFLIHLGLFLLMATGIMGLLSAFTNPQAAFNRNHKQFVSQTGFGRGKYGV